MGVVHEIGAADAREADIGAGVLLLDRAVKILSPGAVLFTILVWVRAATVGQQSWHSVVNSALYAVLLSLPWLGHRIRPTLRVFLYSIVFFLLGITGLIRWGLFSSGIPPIVVGLLCLAVVGHRRWFVSACVAIGSCALVAAGWVSGYLPLTYDPAAVVRSPAAWLLLVGSFVASVFGVYIWQVMYRRLSTTAVRLRDEEQRLRTILELSPLAIAWADRKRGSVVWNRRALEMFGYAQSEVSTFDEWFRRAYPDPAYRRQVQEQWQADVEAIADGGRTEPREYNITCADGTVRRVEIADARADGLLIGVLTDVTERRRSEEVLRSVYDATPLGLAQVSDRSFTRVNAAFAQLTGYAPEELVGSGSRMLYRTEEEYERAGTELYGRGRDHGVTSVEATFRRKDGREIVVQIHISPIDPSDPAQGHTAVVIDITEHKMADQALRDSEERFRYLSAMTREGILVHVGGVIRDANQGIANLLGLSMPAELIGHPLLERIRFTPDSAQRVEQAMASGESGTYEVEMIREDGSVAFAEIDGRWITFHDQPARLVSVREITRRRQAEAERGRLQEQLQQAMKMEAIGRLAGGVAHDFNNLLTAIMGNVELARVAAGGDVEVRGRLEEAYQAAESAASLTRQLLAFSRRQVVEPRTVDLRELVGRLETMLVRLIGEHILLTTELPEGLWPIKVDPNQFEQVVVNLAVNARDAMPGGGSLRIEAANVVLDEAGCETRAGARPGPYIKLAVTDTGHGMSDEVKAHLFEPFYTTKERGHGTGLGLAMAFGVVEQAGGIMRVESQVGEGTTIAVYLPRSEEPVAESPAREPGHAVAPGRRTVLLVEDEEIVRELAQAMLETLGYTVLAAANGDEAIEHAKQHAESVDLVMTDVVMPGMSGRELAEHLTECYPHLKVLYTSGYTEDVIVHHGVPEEGRDFMPKPYTLQDLGAKLGHLLG